MRLFRFRPVQVIRKQRNKKKNKQENYLWLVSNQTKVDKIAIRAATSIERDEGDAKTAIERKQNQL